MRSLLAHAGTAALGLMLSVAGASADTACARRTGIGFGDTVASIAQRCGINVETLKQFNPGLRDDTLRPGSFVNVPRPAVPSDQQTHGRNRVGSPPSLVTSPRVGAPPTVIMPPERPHVRQPVMPSLNNQQSPFPGMPGKP